MSYNYLHPCDNGCCSLPRSFKDEETFAAIGEKLCLELRGCLSQHGFSPFSPDREITLKGQIVAAKLADNPIRKVIGKQAPLNSVH